MPSFTQFRIAGIICAIMTSSLAAFPTPVGTAFSYQGVIKSGGVPLSGTADFQFTLFDAASGPNQIGSTVAVNNVSVSNGVMNATLDFGALAFDGNDRWLEIAVRSPAGGGAFTTLSPRQRLAAVPYAQQTRGMFVDSVNNRIGLGTTTPAYALHVKQTGPVLVLQDTAIAANQAGYVTYWNNNGVETAWVGYGTPGSTDFTMYNGRGALRLHNPSGVVLTATLGGNVGIGTTAPDERLTVAGSMELGTTNTDYQHLRIGGGTSSGFLYGSFPALGNGIHLTYNHYFDAAGTPHYVNSSIARNSRISMGYGTIELKATPGVLGGTEKLVHIEDGNNGGVWINSTSDSGYRFYVNDAPSGFNQVAGNGTIIDFLRLGTVQGSISVSGTTVSYNGFTGSHFAWIENDQTIERGSLVRMTGANRRLHDSDGSDVIYGIEPTSMANDPACLGAYLDVLEPAKPVNADNPLLVMATGNGEMLVTDAGGGDIEPGDWLISSDVPGCAMKDDPARFAVGHLVARAAQRMEWSGASAQADGRRIARISVFFDNAIRQDASSAMPPDATDVASYVNGLVATRRSESAARIDALERENQELHNRLQALEAAVSRLNSERTLNAGLRGMTR